jgi:cysteine desulfurase/selenocysteine lyase
MLTSDSDSSKKDTVTSNAASSVLEGIRKDFALLNNGHEGHAPLVYFDNAATSLKPTCVVEAVQEYDQFISANIHRGVHRLGELATELFERTRATAQNFIGAQSESEIMFTSGTTMGINTVALGWARHHLAAGDEVLLTVMEHHANIVPWHLLAQERGIILKFVPLRRDKDGVHAELDMDAIGDLVGPKTRLASFVMVSNAMGTINPVSEMIRIIKGTNPLTHILLDAAQAILHQPIDVVSLGCSALAFSGHKLLGPTGTGVLYLRADFRDQFKPFVGGGDMIREVTLGGTTFADFPARLEPGTPNISGFIGLGAAFDYVSKIGHATISILENQLEKTLSEKALGVPNLRVVGNASNRIPVLSFLAGNAHPHDLSTLLDRYGVAVRAGHHCAQPLMHALGVQGTTRASLAFYNSPAEIDAFIGALHRSLEILQ